MPNFAVNSMTWNNLTQSEQLESVINESFSSPQLIFKHSTRCGISSMALHRIERQWETKSIDIVPNYLDLIAFRKLSNSVAEKFNVDHESPQVLLISKGKCIYSTSHNDINMDHFNAPLKDS